MPKENPKISGSVPAAVYDRLIDFQKNRGLRSLSQALTTALEDYLQPEPSANGTAQVNNIRVAELEKKLADHTEQLFRLTQQLWAMNQQLEQLATACNTPPKSTASMRATTLLTQPQNGFYGNSTAASVYPVLAANWPELLEILSSIEERLTLMAKPPYLAELDRDRQTKPTHPYPTNQTRKERGNAQQSRQKIRMDRETQTSAQKSQPEVKLMTTQAVAEFSGFTSAHLNRSKRRGFLPLQATVDGVRYSIDYAQKSEQGKNLWSVKLLPEKENQLKASTSSNHSHRQSSLLNSQLSFLSQTAMSERLGVPRTTFRRKKNQLPAAEFAEWTRSHDPDGIAWTFSKEFNNYHPVN
ncbi:MAG TPA: hypothetical protein DDZ80_05335 [Cyanobacteria bacterium UBA8803]|nr:hypothetical protein [Cyanobacteria bacterium UBA9273]HBL57967.1 hypothetical protein [Cyanobacteria bacterium UBA8803]